MPSQSRKPSNYPAASFHTVRFFTFVCAILVAVILAIFTVKLHDVKRKLPIAFLVVSSKGLLPAEVDNN